MKISSSIGYIIFLIAISITIVSSSPCHGEVEDELEFSYEEGGEKGPENWGTLKPEWELCGKGKMQSPIDLKNKKVVIDHNLGYLRSHYSPSNATIKNRGHDIMLKLDGNEGSGITINGTEFQLQQIHWHTPSEHTINGRRFVLEKHMVHQSKDGRNAVVAFLYKLGRPNFLLYTLDRQLQKITDHTQGSEEYVGIIDPIRIDFESKLYYRYVGSLTTPPCSENVIWTIAKQTKTVTFRQLELLRVTVHDQSHTNARLLQRQNGRLVKFYIPAWHI